MNPWWRVAMADEGVYLWFACDGKGLGNGSAETPEAAESAATGFASGGKQ